MYSLKSVRFEPEAANSAVNKEKRKVFAEALLSAQSQNLPILFMDETNFNLHITRSQGRSQRGIRCTTVPASPKGANIHVVGCIGSLGLIHYEVRRGSFKKDSAQEWVKSCLRIAREKYGRPVVLVLDNAPCHSQIEDILDEEEFKDHRILRLGPYSPMLNPIEHVWSVVKAYVKRLLAEKMLSILASTDAILSIKEHRLRALEQLIHESMGTVDVNLCSSCIEGIQG